jgi:hypothetical protein
MTTNTAPAPVTTSTGSTDDELNHLYCCNPNHGLCGTDLTGSNDNDDADITCVVCAELLWDDTLCSPTCDLLDPPH